ncbi:hypothetical protein FGM00_02910 [Aggregatimonas sangjinii]|uniref:Lipoprotein n=1 Tax=Aggregatimonas sangjinii TaxID=2583587 RepID=A0A5B7SKQ5_9FLAO|nr:hypothetical protein [Aggregatimonas sangjinii]QCW99114.1 hypothetical protein FGM00_02910 [Aggregatimonas sangjinii]
MKKFSILLLICMPLLSCSNDDVPVIAACGVANPIEDLVWLREEVARRVENNDPNAHYCYIVQAKTDTQTIFIFEDCNPIINKVAPILDCTGTSLGFLGDENYSSDSISERKIVYRPSDFKCDF